MVDVGYELCCDCVGGVGRVPLSLGLRMEAPPRSGGYGAAWKVVRVVAGVPRLPQHPRVPCSPEGVVGDVRIAPPRTLVSSGVGVFGAFSACLLV